jgi:hypothetical protein
MIFNIKAMFRCFILLFIIIYTDCSGQGIATLRFSTDWELVKKNALKENKNILSYYFLPAGRFESDLENFVFTDPKVISVISDNFVLHSIEKQINSEKVDINGCSLLFSPTFIFYSKEGKPLHQRYAIRSSEELIRISKEINNPDSAFYILKERYSENPSNLDILYKYAIVNSQIGIFDLSVQDFDSISTKYFNSIGNNLEFSLKNWNAIKVLVKSVNDSIFKHFLESRKQFEQLYGEKEVDSFIYNVAMESLMASPVRFQKTGEMSLFYESKKILTAYSNPETLGAIGMVDSIFEQLK